MRPDELLTLERRLSAERLAPYRAAAAGDLSRAMFFYERNSELSAAFWAVLGDLEVVVRNAMDERLRAWSVAEYGKPDWYRDRGGLFTARVLAVPAVEPLRADVVAANRPLGELHAVALTTAGWICPTTRDWIAGRSRVLALLEIARAAGGAVGGGGGK